MRGSAPPAGTKSKIPYRPAVQRQLAEFASMASNAGAPPWPPDAHACPWDKAARGGVDKESSDGHTELFWLCRARQRPPAGRCPVRSFRIRRARRPDRDPVGSAGQPPHPGTRHGGRHCLGQGVDRHARAWLYRPSRGAAQDRQARQLKGWRADLPAIPESAEPQCLGRLGVSIGSGRAQDRQIHPAGTVMRPLVCHAGLCRRVQRRRDRL
ncbi:hypothetical protein CBM2631_B110190 [Cupriavidus taiwanensis]|nr:hypothetical protein CBM2631_B110190 [Cupriavidus taiwanensis]